MQNKNRPVKICLVSPFQTVLSLIAKLFKKIWIKNGFVVTEVNSKTKIPLKISVVVKLLKINYDIINVHVSSYWGFTPAILCGVIGKLRNKKLIITYHGGDPEFFLKKYGWIAKYFFRMADLITIPSVYSKNVLVKYDKRLNKKVKVVYNILDTSAFEMAAKNNIKKENFIITVGTVSRDSIERKGFKAFVKAAKYLPDAKFALIGEWAGNHIKSLKRISSSNVDCTGFVSNKKLRELYTRASVYCQLSKSESFGMALAEAMLCECVPVITNRSALPEVVGDTGFYVPYDNPMATADAIKKALLSPEKGKMARERIISLFSLKEREKQLIRIVNELTEKVMKK